MEKEGLTPEPTKKPKRVQRKRKTSSRSSGLKDGSPASRRLKELWADPEWREEQLRKRALGQAKRKDQGPNKTLPAGRFGVPDGMRKPEALAKWAEAKESAKQTMAELEKAGLLDGADEQAKAALEAAVEVMRSPMDQKIKLAAARLVLDFTKSKPASKTDITVNKAEEWLAAVAATGEDDEGKASEDAQASS
jgi:hypothetical protein